MAIKNITIKRNDNGTVDTLNPTTTWSQVNDKPSTFTPTAHDHTLSDITDAGTVAAVDLNSSTTQYLRGDGTWATIEAGGGDVETVNSISPDVNGNVQLTASDVGAAATSHTHGISAITNLQTSLDAKQDDLGTGTNGQFLRWGALGDPYWDTVTASEVGAASASHTHTFASLTSKPTTLAGYGITDADTSAQVDSKIAALVDSSPATLDTLNELAAALGDDPNFATTVSNSIGTKLSLTGGTMTGPITMTGSGDPIYLNRIGSRGTEIYIGAGESLGSITGGAEQVYIAGESGVSVHASSNNLASGLNRSAQLIDTAGNASWGSGSITAGTFIGALSGNASTASKWATARTITLGGDLTGSVSLDGSANVTLSAQVTNNSHTHDDRYARLSGGNTISGNQNLYGTDTSGVYSSAPIEVREVNLVATGQSSSAYAPAIAWHWGGRAQVSMRLLSNGKLTLDGNQTGQILTTTEGKAVDSDKLDNLNSSQFLRSDATDTFTNLSGTSLTLGSGVTLKESSDRADLLRITSNTSGWGGIQIENSSLETLASFMTDGNAIGIYDDQQNEWAWLYYENSGHTFYHNGSAKLNTNSSGISLSGQIDMNNNDIVGVDQIIHEGDTNTYIQFHASDQWRVVTGGGERLEVNNSSVNVQNGLVINGSIDTGATNYGYYESAGTNIWLKGDGSGRSGIFFESEKNGTNINDPSDFGFIQFHAYGYGGSTGESNGLYIGVANDSSDGVVIQTPYNGGAKIGYKNTTSGTSLTTEIIASREWVQAQGYSTTSSLPLSGGTMSGAISFGSSNANINMSRGSYITLYEDNSANHSISSRNNSGSEADDIRINSYGAVYVNLDSNNNNSSGADFMIGRHGGTSTISELFRVSGENGNVTTSGTVSAGGNKLAWVKTQGTTLQSGVNFTISGSTLYISTTL